jgi:adenylate cyclase
VRALIRASITGTAAALVGALVMLSPFGSALEERFGLGWLFWTRGPLEPPADVAVVSLGSDSAERLGLPARLREWPRGVYADLIERLVEVDSALIVFDLRLDEARDAEDDAALAQAIADAGRVVLFEYLERRHRPMPDGRDGVAGVFTTEQRHPPLAEFEQAAVGLGSFPLPKVPARVSQFWAFVAGGGPTLPIVALQCYAATVDEDWRALLRQAGLPDADGLPSDLAGLGDAGSLSRYMIALRKAFRADPELAQKMSAQLATTAHEAGRRRLLAALLDAYEGPDSRYLNFYGSAGRVPTVPLHAVLDQGRGAGSARPVQLAGRVVFVGQSDLLNPHNDGFITAFSRDDGVDLSGVEIAATAFANLLEGRLIEPVAPVLALALLAAFGLAVGAIGGALHGPIAVPASLVLAGSSYAGAQFAFAQHDLWLPVVTPLLVQLPLGLLLGLLLQYRDAHRARINISRGLHYYLPHRVASGFAETALDPAALRERVFAACMLTDASRFTTLAEAMTPEELSAFLNQYFSILFGVVERRGGLVTDVVGDGTTSVWSAATASRECRRQACLAALDIDRAVTAFNRRSRPPGLPTRIGLNVGEVILGNVGGSGRFAYSVVGDCVNTAARLESLNKQLGTRIIAASEVIEGLDEIVSRPLGRFQLCGRGGAVQVVELVGTAAEVERAGPIPEFAAALAAFEQGRWHEAGSRFDRVLASDPSDGPARFYHSRCERYLTGAPPQVAGVIQLEHK